MKKMRVVKPDGRQLIFYAFDRPLPEVYPDQVKEAGEVEGAARPQPGEPGAVNPPTGPER